MKKTPYLVETGLTLNHAMKFVGTRGKSFRVLIPELLSKGTVVV